MAKVRRGDWVSCQGVPGYVTRAARDGSWADVRWQGKYVKRMPVGSFKIEHTIQMGEWEVTDITRKRELEESVK